MSVFEHSFTLIGLILGLALTHVLSELVRIIRTQGIKSIGLLTPMLAVFVILDVTTFWGILWEMRDELPGVWPVLGIGIILCSLYYIGATYVFPDTNEEWSSLDGYYMKNRRVVLGIMLACFLILAMINGINAGIFLSDPIAKAYVVMLCLTLIAKWRWANVVGLTALIGVDLLAFIPTFL